MSATFWKGHKVFVTGATGMVGSWLVKQLLSAKADVVALIRDADPHSELLRSGDLHRLSVVNGALEDYHTVERAINEHEIDTVFHLGAQTIVGVAHRSPLQTFEANIRGTYNLLDACRVHGEKVKRVIIASSDKAYGAQENLPYTEATPLTGNHPYEISKSCADRLAQAYHHTYGLPVTIARCGNVYGGGDLNWSRIVPGSIRSFFLGDSPIIRSDGTYVRDFIYAKDAVLAYLTLGEKLTNNDVCGQAFNFSNETPLTVQEILSIIQKAMGCEDIKLDIRNDSKGEIHSQYLSAKKSKDILKWKPTYTLESGLAETIEWYKNFLEERV